MKRVLIINGHPHRDSFCNALAKAYKKGTEVSKVECELISLIDLEFSPVLRYGYKKRTKLEPDLKKMWDLIIKSDHLVFIYPNWWGTYPALLKGFIDRLFLPGFAFEYQEKSPFPKKLLTGKTARLIVTTDTPNWYYSLIYRAPGHNSMKKSILGFCGIKPVKITTLVDVTKSTNIQRKIWLEKIENLGRRLK